MATINNKNEEMDSVLDDAEDMPFFPEAGRGKTLLHIVNLARFNPGMIILMGDEGSGRSFLLQKLALRVNQKPGLLAIINRVVKTRPDLYRAIAESFSLETVDGEPVDALEERVLDFLQGCFVTHRPVILAVDDIQQFSLSMLEELLKVMRRYKKISLLLVGDNNLSAMLKHIDTGKAVRHEITLQPQSRGEMRQFINWRLPFAIDDHEFEDIVNTTKGNFALLEREVQKKELAHQSQQLNKKRKRFYSLHFSKRLAFLLIGVFVIAGTAIFYLNSNNELQLPVNIQPTPLPVENPVAEKITATPDASATAKTEGTPDDTNKDVMVDRQMELLTSAPENIKPEVKVAEPEAIQKMVVVDQKPVEVEKKTVEGTTLVEKPKPVIEPVVVAPQVVATPIVETIVVPDKTLSIASADDSAALLSIDAHHYSIQLLGAQSRKTVDRFMMEHQNAGKLYYFRSIRDGKDWYIVLCGDYAKRQDAIQAAADLPEELKKTSPWPRRLSEIHQLINDTPAR